MTARFTTRLSSSSSSRLSPRASGRPVSCGSIAVWATSSPQSGPRRRLGLSLDGGLLRPSRPQVRAPERRSAPHRARIGEPKVGLPRTRRFIANQSVSATPWLSRGVPGPPPGYRAPSCRAGRVFERRRSPNYELRRIRLRAGLPSGTLTGDPRGRADGPASHDHGQIQLRAGSRSCRRGHWGVAPAAAGGGATPGCPWQGTRLGSTLFTNRRSDAPI